MPQATTEIEIEGKKLKLSNLNKVFYPETGFTKAGVIDYYTRVSAFLLPHLAHRPLTLKRYPDGVEGAYFYEKRCPPHRPGWVRTAPIWSEGNGKNVDYCLADDLPTLVWAANLADLELHTSLSLAADIMTPTVVAFDLDPGAPAAILDCAQVGLWLRGIFEQLGLESFPKTSGSKGMQVYVPLNEKGVTYDQTKRFARDLAELLERQHPDRVVSNMKKSLRTGKVFVDWSQNDDHKTTVCVYSLRARNRPTVSTPLKWSEVETAHKKQDPALLDFDSNDVLARVEKVGDLFKPVVDLKQKLPALH